MTDSQFAFRKEHDGQSIYFADTLTQAANTYNNKFEKEEDAGHTKGSHMLLFGIEGWGKKKEVNSLAKAMRDNANPFSRLEIFGCEIKDAEYAALAEGFTKESLTGIRRLDIDNTKLGATGAKQIFERAQEAEDITHLNLQGSVPDAAVLKAISDALTPKCNLLMGLQTLDLKLNGLKDDCAEHLTDLMKKLNPGEHEKFELDFFYNEFGPIAAQAIATGLGEGNRITHLDLCCNKIGDEGAIAIANALRSNESLHTLKLALNDIKIEGGVALLEAFKRSKTGEPWNSTLHTLDLSANMMEEKDVEEAALAELTAKQGARTEAILKRIEDAKGGSDEDKAAAQKFANEQEAITREENLASMKLSRALNAFINDPSNVKDFDFTGIELSAKGWDMVGQSFNKIGTDGYSHHAEPQDVTFRFSIVDLMNKKNLEVMEGHIWNEGKDERYKFLDWRRPKPAAEEKKE